MANEKQLPSFNAVLAVERRVLTPESITTRATWNATSPAERRAYVDWLRQQGGLFAELML